MLHDMKLHWNTAPLYAAVFFLYLLVTAGVASIRGLRLAWHLYAFRGHGPVSLESIRSRALDSEYLAKSALANRVRCEAARGGNSNSHEPQDRASEQAALRILQIADTKFLHALEISEAKVASIQRLSWLTLLISFLVFVFGIFPSYGDAFNNHNVTGIQALFTAMAELLARLALGLGIATFLYAISSFFEGALMQRRARWKYFCSTVKNELSDA